ncbi:MAG: HAD family hydrolase [Patescibacteria group bacterium]
MKDPYNNSYQTVIFDWDGCLADTINTWLDVITEEIDFFSPGITREEVVQANVIGNFHNISQFGINDLVIFENKISAAINSRVELVQMNDHAKDVIIELKRHGRDIAVVTSSRRKFIQPQLDRFEILEYFDIIVTQDDVSQLKPHPEPVEKALSALNADRDTSIIIGDTRNDVLAGKAARIDTALYYPQLHEVIYDKDEVLGLCADYYFRELTEVIDTVL